MSSAKHTAHISMLDAIALSHAPKLCLTAGPAGAQANRQSVWLQRVPHYAAQHNTYLPWKAIAARCRNILVRPFLRGKAPVRVDQRPHVCKLRSRCALGHNCTGPSLPDPCTKLRAIRLLLVQKTHCPKAACANHTARQNALGTPSGSLCRPKCQAACTGQHNEGLLAVQHFPS